MFTIIWGIVFLVAEKSSLSIATLPFWGLILAIVADVFYFGYREWGAGWFRRP